MSVLELYRDHPIEVRDQDAPTVTMTVGEALNKGLFDPMSIMMLETMAESGQLEEGKQLLLERAGEKTKFSLDEGSGSPRSISN